MRIRWQHLVLAAAAAAVALLIWLLAASPARMGAFPRVMLWALDRPERLDFIDPRTTGVAFLDRTIWLAGDTFRVRPRIQPLVAPPNTRLMAVARIEFDPLHPPGLSAEQRAEVVKEIASMARRAGIEGVQVDFEADVQARLFYRKLLDELRRRLPPSTALSITAHPSWCMPGGWMAGLPVDEAVPMLFRTGGNASRAGQAIEAGGDFPERLCNASAGVSAGEPIPRLPRGRRVYAWHPQGWSADDAGLVASLVKSAE